VAALDAKAAQDSGTAREQRLDQQALGQAAAAAGGGGCGASGRRGSWRAWPAPLRTSRASAGATRMCARQPSGMRRPPAPRRRVCDGPAGGGERGVQGERHSARRGARRRPADAAIITCQGDQHVRSSKPHPRAPNPDPRLKPGPVFVASGGVIAEWLPGASIIYKYPAAKVAPVLFH